VSEPSTEGLLLASKPAGPTSHDLVAAVRRVTGQRRVGHTGTLDPQAEGLLLLVLGASTRLARFLPDAPKCYEGTFELGLTTETDDVTGEVLSQAAGSPPPRDSVLAATRELVGAQMQRPPRISARKIGGRRLYRLARAGVHVEVAPRPIMVHHFDLEPTASAWVYRFRTDVSAGTYIRALVRDLGERLGCGGTLAALRRTRIGELSVEDALPIDPASPPGRDEIHAAIVPPSRMPLAPPTLRLPGVEEVRRFRHGSGLPTPDATDGLHTVRSPDGALLGVGRVDRGRLQPHVVLPAAEAAV
jgi:tRNA pseudouridine55 synthase